MMKPEAGRTPQASRKESPLVSEGPVVGRSLSFSFPPAIRTGALGSFCGQLLGRPLLWIFGFDSSCLHSPCACSHC